MDTRPLIDVHSANVTFQGLKALNGVTLTVRAGEHLVLRGGNGAGKSTLLRLLRGEQWLDQENGGTIVWHEADGDSESPLAGRTMAALVAPAQQDKILMQGWDITGEDLILGGITDVTYVLRHAETKESGRIHELAEELDAENLLKRRVPEFSQGELRRLLVARGLIRNPAVLLLDEVTDGLDGEARQLLLAMLKKAARLATLIISTHRPDTLPTWMRREICMEHGKIVSDHSLPSAASSASVSIPAGKQLASSPIRLFPASTHIKIENATVYLNRRPVLHNINWTIMPGQNWVVLGENGAGKSTLMRLIAGDEVPAWGGSIRREFGRCGEAVQILSQIKKRIRLVSDLGQATYSYDLTGEELVLSGIDNSIGLYRTISEEEHTEAARCLALLGVEHLASRSIRHCSTGELRRLLLARALAGSPNLLLLDEPCSGLDPASRKHFLSIVDELIKQGVQIVLVTHHEGEILPSITNLLCLEHGRITYCGPYTGGKQ